MNAHGPRSRNTDVFTKRSRQSLQQPVAPAVIDPAERPIELPERLPPLRRGLCRYQIRQALDRREVELAILEGAPGELARNNAVLVERMVKIAQNLGREVATPKEARKIIGLVRQ